MFTDDTNLCLVILQQLEAQRLPIISMSEQTVTSTQHITHHFTDQPFAALDYTSTDVSKPTATNT